MERKSPEYDKEATAQVRIAGKDLLFAFITLPNTHGGHSQLSTLHKISRDVIKRIAMSSRMLRFVLHDKGASLCVTMSF